MKKIILCSILLSFCIISSKAQNLYYKSLLKLYNQGSYHNSTVAIGDIDNDKDNDILDYNSDSLCYVWNENNGHGSFTNFHLIKGLIYGNYSEIKITDIDIDGFNDIIAISNNSYAGVNGGVFILKGLGNGNFESTYQVIYYCNILDYDNDGDLDLVHIKDSIIFINRNTSSGFTRPERLGNLPTLNLSKVIFIKITDLNSDQHPDLLFLTKNSTYPYVPSPQYIFRSYNNGNNEFNPIDTLDINTSDMFVSLMVDDLNNDNNQDIIAPSYQTYWFENLNNFSYYKHHLIVSGERLIIDDINKRWI